METKIARASFEEDKRIIVISNVHGYLGFLKSVLKKVAYSPYRDILVFNGNIIEKGPHSLQTIRYISQLSDDGDVYLVMGNSEAFQLMFLSDDSPVGDDKIYRYIISRRITFRSCLLSEMFYEMGYPVESAKDIQRAKKELKKRYMPEIMFLNSMPTILETKDLIFVHGGIPNEDLDSFEGQDALQFLKRDAYLEHCKYEFSKFVITGGWPSHLYSSTIQSQRPIIDRKRKIVSIAGGAGYKFDGQVNALIINDPVKGNFEFVSEDGFQEGIALTPQKASTDSINIRRTSNLVRILEQGAEFSYVQHRATGRKLYMYNRYLHSDEEYTTCEDYTDYVLPIKQGDRLSVLFETSNGYLVKKNGITGWYKGTIEMLPKEEIITEEEILSMHQVTQIVNSNETPKYIKQSDAEEVKDEGFSISQNDETNNEDVNIEENNFNLDEGNIVDSQQDNENDSVSLEQENEDNSSDDNLELTSDDSSNDSGDNEETQETQQSIDDSGDNTLNLDDGNIVDTSLENEDDSEETNEEINDAFLKFTDFENKEDEENIALDEELLAEMESLDSDDEKIDDIYLEEDLINEDDKIDESLINDLEKLDGASEDDIKTIEDENLE